MDYKIDFIMTQLPLQLLTLLLCLGQRHRDRETERHRDIETERKGDIEIKIQDNKVT